MYTPNIHSIWVPIAKSAVNHTLGLLLFPIVGKKETLLSSRSPKASDLGDLGECSKRRVEGSVFVVSTKAMPNAH